VKVIKTRKVHDVNGGLARAGDFASMNSPFTVRVLSAAVLVLVIVLESLAKSMCITAEHEDEYELRARARARARKKGLLRQKPCGVLDGLATRV
jgi:hypothetical protein